MKSFLKSFLSFSLSLSPSTIGFVSYLSRVACHAAAADISIPPQLPVAAMGRTDAGCENSAADKETKMDAGILEAGFGVLTRWNIHWAKVRVSISSRLASLLPLSIRPFESNRSLRTLGIAAPAHGHDKVVEIPCGANGATIVIAVVIPLGIEGSLIEFKHGIFAVTSHEKIFLEVFWLNIFLFFRLWLRVHLHQVRSFRTS